MEEIRRVDIAMSDANKFFAVKTKQGYRLVEATDIDNCRQHVGRHAEIREASVTLEDVQRARGNPSIREEIFYRSKKTGSAGRDQIMAADRFTILARDNFTCQACGAQPGNERLHVDHILPWSLGGSNNPLNLTTLCKSCNLGKGARIWIPPKLLLTPFDDEGFAVWKQFGSWNIEVSEGGGMIANWNRARGRHSGYTWFDVDRCWDGHGNESWDGWLDHFGRKSLHIGCDDDCPEITHDDIQTCALPPGRAFRSFQVSDPLPWISASEEGDLGALARHGRDRFHSMVDLATAIEFMRAVYRRNGRR